MDIELAVLCVRLIGVIVLPGVFGQALFRLLFADADHALVPNVVQMVAAALALGVCAWVPSAPTTGFICFG